MIYEKIILLMLTYVFLYLTTNRISEKRFRLNYISVLCVAVVILLNVYIFKIDNGLIKGFITFIGFFIYAKLGMKCYFKESIIIGFVMYFYVVVGEIISSLILIILNLDTYINITLQSALNSFGQSSWLFTKRT